MVEVYNPQWGRGMAVDDALMGHMARNGFTPSHTGGGCFAWERVTADGGYVWITESSGTELGYWSERSAPVWLVGRYSGDSEDWITVDCCPLFRALELAATLRAPVEGEQLMVSDGEEV